MASKNLRLQVILEGLDRVTAPLKAITGASSNARKDLAETHKQLQKLDAAQQQVGKYKAAEGRFAADTQALAQQRAKMEELRATLEKTEAPTKKLRNEFARAEKQTTLLTAKVDRGGDELQQLSRQLGEAGIDVADLARHENDLAIRTHDANQALKRQTEQLDKVAKAQRNTDRLNEVSAKATGLGLGMVAAGTAAGAPIVMATKQAMTLEAVMADVRKVVDFDSPQAFAQMTSDILDMSERIPMAAEGIAAIVAAAGRANVPREELLRFAEDAAKMGVAFESTAEDAGATMAKWRTAFELPQDGVVELADQINALTNTYGGNVSAVTEMVTRIGPLGKVGGLAAAQIASMGQVLSSVGVESEIGATGIKNMMLALTKGSAATKSQQKAFASLGLDAEQVGKAMQKDAGGAILDVLGRLQGLSKEAQASTLTQLFGSESVGAIAPMLNNLDQLRENFALVGDSSRYAGSMNAEYLGAIATAEGATGLATNGLKALNITMGQYLLPTVVKVAGMVAGAAKTMRSWAQEHPVLAKGIMMFVGAGAALLILLGTLALGFAALTAAAAPLGIALGPLLLIVAAVAAVAAAAYLIYDSWDGIVAYFSGIWSGILDAIRNAVGFLRSLDFGQIGRDLIQGLINGMLGKLAALKETIVSAASSVAKWFKEKLGIHSPSRVFAGLGGFVMEGLDQGLAANTAGPLQRISQLSGQMTRALSVGAGGAAVAIAGPAAAQGGASASAAPAAAPSTYHIEIKVSGVGVPEDIADAVRRAIEQIERERRGRGYGDD
ncbi:MULTISPECIES: phage tail tape measure protein [unclassified Sphingobium]|uniref:phage tail tape measure protein n=1 Tax=unclassified Sphingobium TaxID=2611147 RepID=UPI002224C439|nr:MULTISPECIES: phage tail tape measure protein [unclassified Sphingobium]MCW2410864.1 TP901 family phage tail tape measure protein [Sphingobium sp. B8D3D]MCW2416846.1 TP901 family phage tail tape measure protein [Sphingobium sp. B8D3A]